MSSHNRIKELRNKKGLSQKEFAKAFNEFMKNSGSKKTVSYATISRWERGENEPKLEIWLKLSDFFDVPVYYLQGISDYASADEKEINRLRSLAFRSGKKVDLKLLEKVHDMRAVSMSEALKKEFKGANQIIDILFSGDPSREDYKKVIANLNLTMQSAESDEPLSLYFYILSEMSKIFFSALKGDDFADKCIMRYLSVSNGYYRHLNDEYEKHLDDEYNKHLNKKTPKKLEPEKNKHNETKKD